RTRKGRQTFFFKVKYDDPYLMYREWREVTKAILAKKKPRMNYSLTKHYVDWVKEKYKSEPELFKDYNKGQGIIRVRELFLEYWRNKGEPLQEAAESQDAADQREAPDPQEEPDPQEAQDPQEAPNLREAAEP